MHQSLSPPLRDSPQDACPLLRNAGLAPEEGVSPILSSNPRVPRSLRSPHLALLVVDFLSGNLSFAPLCPANLILADAHLYPDFWISWLL